MPISRFRKRDDDAPGRKPATAVKAADAYQPPAIVRAHRGGYENRPGWWIQVKYSAAFVERLKRRVPAADRRWSYDAGSWWISLDHEQTILDLLPSFWPHLQQQALL